MRYMLSNKNSLDRYEQNKTYFITFTLFVVLFTSRISCKAFVFQLRIQIWLVEHLFNTAITQHCPSSMWQVQRIGDWQCHAIKSMESPDPQCNEQYICDNILRLSC